MLGPRIPSSKTWKRSLSPLPTHHQKPIQSHTVYYTPLKGARGGGLRGKELHHRNSHTPDVSFCFILFSFTFQELSLGKMKNRSNPISLPGSASLIFKNKKFPVHEKSKVILPYTYKDLFFQDRDWPNVCCWACEVPLHNHLSDTQLQRGEAPDLPLSRSPITCAERGEDGSRC